MPDLLRDRLQMAFVGLAVVAFMSVIAAGGAWQAALAAKDAANASTSEVLEGQENANASRAALCQTLLYDDDRLDADAPIQDAPCRWAAVIDFYPPEVCEVAPRLGAPDLCTPVG